LSRERFISRGWLCLFCGLLLLVGCRQEMANQPRFEPLEASSFFADGRAARPLVPGTVARGQLRLDTHLHEGKVDGAVVETLPFPLSRDLLTRGRERYVIFCSPCHDRTGAGQGLIVQRGFPRPPSFHTDRLRDIAIGHFVEVMTEGFGLMPRYAAQLDSVERWAIAAYIRALQLSQHATIEDVPDDRRSQLQDLKP
jgi:cytochrome c553